MQTFLKNQSEAAAKEKQKEAEQAKAVVSGGSSSSDSRAAGAGLAAAMRGGQARPGGTGGVSSAPKSMSQEEAMRLLVQGGAPVMVLELQATGPGLPQPGGIKVAITIWSASHGERVWYLECGYIPAPRV